MRRVIGLAGKFQSGKDTLGEHLVDKLYSRKYFAEPIKRALSCMLGVSVKHMDQHKDDAHPVLGKTYRQMMQTLGTEWGRNQINKDIWTLLLKDSVQTTLGDVVVTDVRFPNEVKVIKELGGVVINIVRPGCKGDDHVSENSLDPIHFDYVIDNNSTIDNLYAEFDQLEKLIYEPTR